MSLKESTIYAIKDFAMNHGGPIEGDKLKALYRLIQWKGVEITETTNMKLHGLKAYQFTDCDSIAIKRVGSESKFFPCVMTTFLMTNL